MRISWDWLRSLVDVDVSAEEAADLLTSSGLEVEHIEVIEPVKGMLAGVVVGHVLEVADHPDADRLRVCRVDLGAEHGEAQIVCGAPNVAKGQSVLVATVGAELHMQDGSALTIRKAKIRGVESQGMICAEDELGLGESHEGIMVLEGSPKAGTPASAHLGLKSDRVFEIGLTPNRSDALGHLGVARELAAVANYRTGASATLQLPDVSSYAQDDEARQVQVEVKDPHACPRYAGTTLTQVQVAPSPSWLQERLKSIGLKPINNVVDITNFVQHELGQPLHAFDADRIAEDRIIVRHLTEGTAFTTLDGTERKLSDEDLMITDPQGGLCMAGVFGGLGSGVTNATTTVFLESACFAPIGIRRTARRHGLNTDASFRFERGVDPELAEYALKRAALLMREVCGAKISAPITDHYPHPVEWVKVDLHLDRLERIAGSSIPAVDVEQVLELLGCRVEGSGAKRWQVAVPPFRVDVRREVDLIEEVLRVRGFDRIPAPAHLMLPSGPREEITLDGLRRALATHLAARGFQEVMTPSLVNGEQHVSWHAEWKGQLVRLRNPLSKQLDVLRPDLTTGMVEAAAYNAARQQRDVRLFEQGRTYLRKGERVVERNCTGLLVCGKQWTENWNTGDEQVDHWTIKAEVEAILQRFGMQSLQHSEVEDPLLSDALAIVIEKREVARLGRPRNAVQQALGQDLPCWMATFFDDGLVELLRKRRTEHQEVPRYPAVRRDLSLLLDRSVTFEELERSAYQAERKLLRRVQLFDVYEGDKLPKGKKSYALSFTLQDRDGTLTDAQVEKAMARIRGGLEKGVKAELRS
ncbi:MAG: phenylalanine--tRNA ligase subunit beta [Flavobacteriales bacterium]|nr:phenylalanine--tRNA ligase subunit beta [Flavobacteriales bacterium]